MLKQSYLIITIQCINTCHVDITKFEAISLIVLLNSTIYNAVRYNIYNIIRLVSLQCLKYLRPFFFRKEFIDLKVTNVIVTKLTLNAYNLSNKPLANFILPH